MSVNPSQSWITPTTALFGNSNGGYTLPSTIGVQTITTSTIKGVFNTTDSNVGYNAIDFVFRPAQAVQGGIIYQKLEWDAVDTGANYALILGATPTTALISSEWPGYISMPLTIAGATISLVGDNETFLFLNANAGALGSISTGTPFLSGSNLFSSITDPTLAYKADMTALLSTFKDLYPACFS